MLDEILAAFGRLAPGERYSHQADPWGATRPYVLLGPAGYVSHRGERPIAITWRLRNPIPADRYETFKVAAA